MVIFKKRAPDIDFTDMQKRGFVRKAKPAVRDSMKVNSQGFVEFSVGEPTPSGVSSMSSTNPSSSDSVSPFGFLDNLASAPSVSPASSSVGSAGSGLESGLNINNDISNVKIAVDNLDFKLGHLMERLEKIESKLLEFENKAVGGFRI